MTTRTTPLAFSRFLGFQWDATKVQLRVHRAPTYPRRRGRKELFVRLFNGTTRRRTWIERGKSLLKDGHDRLPTLFLKTQTRTLHGSQPTGAVLRLLFHLGTSILTPIPRGLRLGLQAVEWMVQAPRYRMTGARLIVFPSLRCGAPTPLKKLPPKPLRHRIPRRAYRFSRRML